MSREEKTPQEQALEAIGDLVGSDAIEFYVDIALDAVGSKLAKNKLFEGLGIDPKTAGISDVLAALVRANILQKEVEEIPYKFDEAFEGFYEFGDISIEEPRSLLAELHDKLKEAIESLAKKHPEAKP